MVDHLLLLGATRQIPTLGLHDLGEVLGPLLQCKKTAALGFKVIYTGTPNNAR
jgi:hypothetical protein